MVSYLVIVLVNLYIIALVILLLSHQVITGCPY